MTPRTTTLVISIFCFCLTGLSTQAEVYSDSSKAIRLLSLSEKEKDTKKAFAYALQSLSIGARLENHLIMAKSYRRLSYLYRPERKPQLYEMDSLFIYHAGRSGNEELLFDALQLMTKDYLNNMQVARAEKYLPQLDSLANKADTTFRKCISAQIKAFYHFKRFRPRELLAEATISLDYANKLQNKRLIGRSLCLVGEGYQFQMKHDSAATFLFKSIEELKKINDDEEIARIYGRLGFLFQTTGNLSRAVDYYELSHAAFVKAGFLIDAAYVPLTMSDIYFTQRKYDTAFISINRALNIFRKYAYPQGIGLSYSYLGRYYTKMNQRDSADYYTALSKETLKQYNNPLLTFYVEGYDMANALENRNFQKGDSLLKKLISQVGDIAPADFLNSAADMVVIQGFGAAEKELTKQILKGDTSRLIDDTVSFNPFTGTLPALDSLITQQQHREIAAIEVRYKVKEAQDSTKIAQKENLLVKQQLTQRNLVLLFSFLLLAVSGLLLYFQVKNRKRALAEKKRALNDKTTIEHLKDELDHRVGNTLNNISFIIRLVKARSADNVSFELLEEKIDPLLVLYRMLSVNKTEDINLQEYFEKICHGLKASYDHDDKITIHIDALITMTGSKAGRVGLILNELVTNAFKHAFTGQATGHIAVICKMTDDEQYYLSVTDSGPGIQKPAGQGTQKGLQLVRALAHQLEATIREKQEAGVGFEFYFL